MSLGSGLMNKQRARRPHLAKVTGEVGDLRRDVEEEVSPLAAMAVEEFTDPAAAGADLLEAAAATTVAPRTAVLLQAGLDILDHHPRPLTFTTAGATPADAPANAVITGEDVNGDAMTETVAVPQTATIQAGVKCFTGQNLSVVYEAADGTDATVAVGIGTPMGLGKKLKSRAGSPAVLHEIEVGTPKAGDALAGTYVDAASSPPNGSYSPGSVADGSKDYALFYEYDPT